MRRLTDGEKALLAPYIPEVDLETATVHEGKVPWYLPKRFAGITRGNRIYFRSGAYNPGTAHGIALLGHEMVHVGQYREGMTAIKYLWSSRKGYSAETKYEKPAYTLEWKIFGDLLASQRDGLIANTRFQNPSKRVAPVGAAPPAAQAPLLFQAQVAPRTGGADRRQDPRSKF